MSEQEAISAGKLAAVYIKIRTKRSEIKAAYEAEDGLLQEQMDAIEAEMLEKCKEEDADSIKTPFGTIIRSVKQRFWPADWDAFNTFVLQHEALGLLEKRVHQTNMATWLEENPNDPPPGLNIDRRYACSVRKASK
jgi:hypothetical protein